MTCSCYCPPGSAVIKHASTCPEYDPHEHDCPREAFLNDPITVAYGVGSEMLHLIRCEVCEQRERDDREPGPNYNR